MSARQKRRDFGEGRRIERRRRRYVTCSAFWLPYTYVNFARVAPAKRVQFMAAGNLVWSAFIDWLAHRKHNTAEKREPARGYATTVVAGRLAGSPT